MTRTSVDVVRRLVSVVGSRVGVADLIGADRASVDAWLGRGVDAPEAVPPLMARRLDHLRAVLVDAGASHGWLLRPSQELDGAHPVDVLMVEGPDRVVAAWEDYDGPMR